MENLLPKGMLGTPRRTVVAGVAALVLATILLLVYLAHYRSSVKSQNALVPVLTAKSIIPKGTTALEAARRNLYGSTSFPKDRVANGAITDAGAISGEVALSDILPNTQLTTTEWGTTAVTGELSGSAELLGTGKATGTWRAMSINLDAAHGIVPQVQTDDSVDVYVFTNGAVRLLMANVLILAAPNEAATGTSAPTSPNYILRIPSKLAPKLALATETGKLWFALRPQRGAKPEGSGSVGRTQY